MSNVVVIIFYLLVFVVPIAALLIVQDWDTPDPRSLRKQLFDFGVVIAGILALDITANLVIYGTAVGKWQALYFAAAYTGGNLTRIATIAILRLQAAKTAQ